MMIFKILLLSQNYLLFMFWKYFLLKLEMSDKSQTYITELDDDLKLYWAQDAKVK